ncbi:MAG TPA: suppressor of fused domain protein [Bryobacteraceae bacterium]|nr:suppressor of fused domain protein [Bryobacteraceae bacterium]
MPDEQSPGGSTIHRYTSSQWARPQLGLRDELSLQFAAARERVYKALFGEAQSVFHEAIPLLPHIDVHTYARSSPRGKVYALVTSGMSDLRMRVPPAAGKDAPRRVELIFYCAEPKQEYIETLRWVARFPHDQKTWLSFGHTIPNGDPPAPFWGSEILEALLCMPTIVQCDQALPEKLILAGDPVHFLWVVPLSMPECDLKLEQGFGAILDLFGKNRHPHVFDPGRRSYV